MNYYCYILFALSFIVFGIHASISSRIKEGEILADNNAFYLLLLRVSPLLGYVLLAINLFSIIHWFYAIIILLLGIFLVPAIMIKVLTLFFSHKNVRYLINPYPNTILAYIALSLLSIIFLSIELF